jgi:hypothetical protein
MSESGMSVMAGGVLKVGERVELEPVAGGKASAPLRHKLGRLYGFEFVALRAEHAPHNESQKFVRNPRCRAAFLNAKGYRPSGQVGCQQ